MENYIYQNTLISKKQLKDLLSWCFTKYGSIKACFLADELKYLGFKTEVEQQLICARVGCVVMLWRR